MSTVVDIISIISSQLNQLGWDWETPRVQQYLLTVTITLRGNFRSVAEIPEKYLVQLGKLLTVYEQCNKLLSLLNLSWESPIVQRVFKKYPYGDKMPFPGWNELYEVLEHEWFVNGGGF